MMKNYELMTEGYYKDPMKRRNDEAEASTEEDYGRRNRQRMRLTEGGSYLAKEKNSIA